MTRKDYLAARSWLGLSQRVEFTSPELATLAEAVDLLREALIAVTSPESENPYADAELAAKALALTASKEDSDEA